MEMKCPSCGARAGVRRTVLRESFGPDGLDTVVVRERGCNRRCGFRAFSEERIIERKDRHVLSAV
jgi:hypothetical protein